MQDESAFVCHEPCPECGSRDNLARYASGRGHCHGCGHNEFPEGYKPEGGEQTERTTTDYKPIQGEFRDIEKDYGIDLPTCRRLGIMIARYGLKEMDEDGELQTLPPKNCITFDYRNADGSMWGQKVRYALGGGKKTFRMPHGSGKAPIFGMHRWAGMSRKGVILFGGEGDCAAYDQAVEGKFPSGSFPKGEKAVLQAIRDHYDELIKYDRVVICLDGDATGREWAPKAAELLPPGKAFIGEVADHKDARDALRAGDIKAITGAYWNARPYRPDGIVVSSDAVKGLRQRRRELQATALTYPWGPLQEISRGMRAGTLIVWTAGSGIGKSTIVRHVLHHVHTVHQTRVGMLMLEEDKDISLDGFIGIHLKKNLIVDPEACTDEEHEQAILDLALDDPDKGIVLYDHFGSTDVDNICNRVRYMAKVLGCKVIGLDHISIMVSGTDTGDERKLIDVAMTKLRTLVQETGITLHAVVHLKRPQGDKGHEDGAAVGLGQLRGSHAIAQLSDQCIAGQKDPQDPLANVVDLMMLKNRLTGQRGHAGRLSYDLETGVLSEVPGYDPESRERSAGFANHETTDQATAGLDI